MKSIDHTMPEENEQVAPPEDFAAYEAWRNAPEAAEQEESEAAEPEEGEEAESASESETDEEAEQDEQGEEAKPEEEQPKKKGGFQRRIDRLTREKAELADRVARLEQGQLAPRGAGEAPHETVDQPKQPAATSAEKEPDPKDFSTWEEYTAAMVDFRLTQREKKRAEEDEQRRQTDARKAAAAKWSEQVEQGRDEYDDFDDVVVKSRRPASPVVQQFILESEVGRHVAYELGKDPGALERINKLGPIAAVKELSRIEAKHTADPAAPKEKPKVTKAPPPVKPAAGKVKTAPRLDDPNLSFEDYERLRKQQLAKRR